MVVEVDGRRVPVSMWGDRLRTPPPAPPSAAGGHGGHGQGELVLAPMQGTILQVLVELGQAVKAGQPVCILEAMKMENHIAAHQDGTVSELLVAKGDVVETNQPLAVID